MKVNFEERISFENFDLFLPFRIVQFVHHLRETNDTVVKLLIIYDSTDTVMYTVIVISEPRDKVVDRAPDRNSYLV